MEVICLENEAFYALIEEVVQRLKEKNNVQEDKWISGEEVMQKMRIKSKTTLQRLRDEGRIRFTQPDTRISFMTLILSMSTLRNMPRKLSNHAR